MDKIKIRVPGRKVDFVEVTAKLFGNGNVAVHKYINFWGLDADAIEPNHVDNAYTITHVSTGFAIWPNSFTFRRSAWACAEDVAIWFDQFCDKCQSHITKMATEEQIAELKAIIKVYFTGTVSKSYQQMLEERYD